MVADDSEALCKVLQRFLEMMGYAVDTTIDAKRLTTISKNFPDVILLDICFRGYDGTEICRTLKARKETKKIPVIMMSGMRDIQAIALGCGADDYITKPFSTEDLLLKINTHLVSA